MNTMQAIVFEEAKNFDALRRKEVDKPQPKPTEVIVQIKACALNHRDVWITQGLYPSIKVPIILGSDGAGFVEQVGSDVGKQWLGKEVIINPGLGWGDNPRVQSDDYRILGLPDNGTQAQFVAVPAANVLTKPAYLSFAEAAATPLGGLTGYRALFTQGQLQRGQNVLLTGIGGGVASLMLQMAVATGANVYVTSGDAAKIDRACHAGAQGGVNYKDKDWPQTLNKLLLNSKVANKQIDLIVDSACGDGINDLIKIVKPGGRIVFFGMTKGIPSKLDVGKLFWKQITLQGTTMGSNADFAAMLELFQKHKIKPTIDGPYPFNEYKLAYERMMSSSQYGKIVLEVD